MEIKIYAPVDCDVLPITDCDDDVFAKKMMGDGLVLIPKSNEFKSFLEDGSVALIFDTKHAIFFETQAVKILMHIGMDTVALNGKPFNVKIKKNQKVDLKTSVVDVDFEKIKEQKLSIQTPICFDSENLKNIDIKILKKSAKQGELIATAQVELQTTQTKPKDELFLEEYLSKYTQTAQQLIELVGGNSNFTKVYNCMTRVRFLVNDLSKIDQQKIKKIELVKGTNLNGSELQVIIGGECYKVKDEIEKIRRGDLTGKSKVEVKKPPVYKRIMTAISGVMVPLIPPLMAVGIFSALYSVLLQANIIVDYGSTNNPDVWSTIFYVLSKVALNLIGVMFCYSVVAYFGGNPIFAILVGLTLSSRILLAGVSAPVADPGFGQFIVDPTKGISGWLLFKILDYPFVVTAYEGSVLPYVFAAFIVIFADKWIKTWMPTSVDIIFRPFLVYFLAVIPTLFIFGPLLGLIEMGLSQVVMTFEKDVTGIGVGLFAFLW
ncbi:glucose PTS transporter subunit IIA [Spiroplasma clarkii]|uniref:glucose PTS transporter subunit IIA n=2 Tax=Spiroplasma clarkii TaxID=2139 RepID=UPI001473EAE4|nr:glucose PTS transporter subunit IIA [Spiroplasma clarkii]